MKGQFESEKDGIIFIHVLYNFLHFLLSFAQSTPIIRSSVLQQTQSISRRGLKN